MPSLLFYKRQSGFRVAPGSNFCGPDVGIRLSLSSCVRAVIDRVIDPARAGKASCAFRSSPVALYPATSESEKISFNQLNRATGHRIEYLKVKSD
jgi:hypothetical protein